MKERLKNILSKILIPVTMTFCFFLTMPQMAYGAEQPTAIDQVTDAMGGISTEPVEIVDENGNIMGIFTPFSATNPPPRMTRYTANINWTLESWEMAAGGSQFGLTTSSKVSLNISFPSGANSGFGLYDRDSETYGWAKWTSDGYIGGTITPSYSGQFSIAICNNTQNKVTYTGSFTV